MAAQIPKESKYKSVEELMDAALLSELTISSIDPEFNNWLRRRERQDLDK